MLRTNLMGEHTDGSDFRSDAPSFDSHWPKWFTVIAVLATLPNLLLLYQAMAELSLWTDELGAVRLIAAEGPWHVVTHYALGRNHVLFTLLNSLPPWAGVIDPPALARVVSFVMVGLTAFCILWMLARRGLSFVAAAVFVLWGWNSESLQLALQARGYGLLQLIALLSTITSIDHARSLSRNTWVALTLLTIAGSWTIPHYAIFGATLMGILWLAAPTRWKFWVMTSGGVFAFLLYAPIIGEVFDTMFEYGNLFGRQFDSFAAVADSLARYTWPGPKWLSPCLLVLHCGLVVSSWRRLPSRIVLGPAALLAAALVFFLVCRLLGTAPIRTTAFVSFPLQISAFLLLSMLVPLNRVAILTVVPAALAVLSCALVLPHREIREIENWRLASKIVTAIFPPGTIVDAGSRADGITFYINQDLYPVLYTPERHYDENDFDFTGFSKGRFPLVETPDFGQVRPEIDAKELDPRAISLVLSGSSRFIWINFVPPARSVGVGKAGVFGEFGAIADGDASTHAEFSEAIRVRVGSGVHSLNMIRPASNPEWPLIIIQGTHGEKWKPTVTDLIRLDRFQNLCLNNLNFEPAYLILLPASRRGRFAISELWWNASESLLSQTETR